MLMLMRTSQFPLKQIEVKPLNQVCCIDVNKASAFKGVLSGRSLPDPQPLATP